MVGMVDQGRGEPGARAERGRRRDGARRACSYCTRPSYTDVADLSLIVGFGWVDNARKSIDRHGVGQAEAEAEAMFFRKPLLIVDDTGHSLAEPRIHALGRTREGRLLQATFTLRRGGTHALYLADDGGIGIETVQALRGDRPWTKQTDKQR